ncbi:MAG: methyltransferase domain-containing protein [Methanoregulaceae archaeon]|nr:methyltransferase domain-containing protein [Methanoregulaceae archaeon]
MEEIGSSEKDLLLYDVDWNEVWRERMRLHRSSASFTDSLHVWKDEDNARRYEKTARKGYGKRIRDTLEGLSVTSGTRVLDIGSGPGTIAIPLAKRVGEITAVEPAAGMVNVLKERIAEEGIKNIRIVKSDWEDVDIERDLEGMYDIVIGSLSLNMTDMREAARKMNAVCSGTVNLYWFADMPFWERNYSEVWPKMHGSSYHPGPKVDCLFMLLCQMGIYPDVTMMPLDKEYRFSRPEEMFDHFRARFGVTTDHQEDVMRRHLLAKARRENGCLVLSGDTTYARISWRVGR